MGQRKGPLEDMGLERSFWKNKKVLVTGHTGFKGSWLVFVLNSLGAEICGYSLAPQTTPNLFSLLNLEGLCESHIGDIRNGANFKKVAEDFQPDILFHLAAQPLVLYSYKDPIETYEVNVIGTLNVLEGVKNIKTLRSVVVITTDKVYENLEDGTAYSEENRLGGHDMYSSSKACAEIVTQSWRSSFGKNYPQLKIATARSGNVIGGGDWADDRLVPDVVRSISNKKPLSIRSPEAVRPWQHVLNPTFGYLTLAQKLWDDVGNNYTDAWNFGPEVDDVKTVREMTDIMCEKWGGYTWTSPDTSNKSPMKEANLLHLDIGKAKSNLGWRPVWDCEKSLQKTIEWYKKFYEIPEEISELTKKQILDYQK